MPYTNIEFINAIKNLKTEFLNRLKLDSEDSPDDKIRHEVNNLFPEIETFSILIFLKNKKKKP